MALLDDFETLKNTQDSFYLVNKAYCPASPTPEEVPDKDSVSNFTELNPGGTSPAIQFTPTTKDYQFAIIAIRSYFGGGTVKHNYEIIAKRKLDEDTIESIIYKSDPIEEK